ncbi:MAG: ABC transporter ATP-binding protein [Hyphomicrobiales bacterium]|nr:ABC transporter ATP-binding protein [Hyphomicrobiales bacterium]
MLRKRDATDDIIRVRGLTKGFSAQTVFENLDLTVRRGEILGVVGASGTGKSVLLRTLLGIERADAGSIEIFGRDMGGLSNSERIDVERRWGVLFQDGALFSSMTVLQNIQTPMREQIRLPAAAMDDLARLKLAMVGLPADAAHKYPSELSGGMRKRAGLARALALDPEIVFLDEPTSGLDPIGAAAFDRLIQNLQKTLGLTVYMVTHDLDSIFAVCDRVAVLADRHVVRTGAPSELARDPRHAWIEQYFCGDRARAARASSVEA